MKKSLYLLGILIFAIELKAMKSHTLHDLLRNLDKIDETTKKKFAHKIKNSDINFEYLNNLSDADLNSLFNSLDEFDRQIIQLKLTKEQNKILLRKLEKSAFDLFFLGINQTKKKEMNHKRKKYSQKNGTHRIVQEDHENQFQQVMLIRKLDESAFDRFSLVINQTEKEEIDQTERKQIPAKNRTDNTAQNNSVKQSQRAVSNKNSKKILSGIGAISIVSLTFLAYKLFSKFPKDKAQCKDKNSRLK